MPSCVHNVAEVGAKLDAFICSRLVINFNFNRLIVQVAWSGTRWRPYQSKNELSYRNLKLLICIKECIKYIKQFKCVPPVCEYHAKVYDLNRSPTTKFHVWDVIAPAGGAYTVFKNSGERDGRPREKNQKTFLLTTPDIFFLSGMFLMVLSGRATKVGT